jgi:hypothetical protein
MCHRGTKVKRGGKICVKEATKVREEKKLKRKRKKMGK